MIQTSAITGLILCGGRGQRVLGQDKGLMRFQDRRLIDHVLERLAPQVRAVLISANRHIEAYRCFGWPVLPDLEVDYSGPLAGLARALESAMTPWVLTVPCDGPWLAHDLGKRLASAIDASDRSVAIAHDGTRVQFTYALINRSLRRELQASFKAGERRLGGWLMRHDPTLVDFSDNPSAFTNLNRPADFARAGLPF